MERVYIGGSISNNPNYLQEFEQAEVRLMRQGDKMRIITLYPQMR